MATVPSPVRDVVAETELDGRVVGAAVPATVGMSRQMPWHAVAGTALAVVGVISVWPTALLLWSLWVTDPLKSIGGFVPLVSLLLILRVWRALGWETHGSWWGLALLAGTAAVVAVRDRAVLELVLGPGWSITLPPHSLVAVAYASGMVLMLGGGRLWRAARFPVALMWFVNPVPNVFNRWIDLPLQHASAEVARGLAHALGQRLTPDQLYLMFTPDFGMFIAPGCDGIRGSVTMGLIALVTGYLYRFRLRTWSLTVAGAVLLGYVFNLLRLCVLVLYYVTALHWHWLQGHAEMADYCIGATLFFFATILLFSVIRRWSPGGMLRLPRVQAPSDIACSGGGISGFWSRCGSFALMVALFAVPYARALRMTHSSASAAFGQARFPEAVGSYLLRRTWSEKLDTGQTIFVWAEYAKPGQADAVEVGVSPVLGAHDTLLCHAAKGEDWLWHGTLTLPTAEGAVNFSGSFFADGSTDALEATTVCSGARCGQWASERKHLGLVYSRPETLAWAGESSSRPIPVMVRVSVPSGMMGAQIARARLTGELGEFLPRASFATFTSGYRQP